MDLLYLSRYVRILGNVVHAIQIKTKLCQLVEVMMERRDDLSFCQEMKFRSGKMTASPFLLSILVVHNNSDYWFCYYEKLCELWLALQNKSSCILLAWCLAAALSCSTIK